MEVQFLIKCVGVSRSYSLTTLSLNYALLVTVWHDNTQNSLRQFSQQRNHILFLPRSKVLGFVSPYKVLLEFLTRLFVAVFLLCMGVQQSPLFSLAYKDASEKDSIWTYKS